MKEVFQERCCLATSSRNGGLLDRRVGRSECRTPSLGRELEAQVLLLLLSQTYLGKLVSSSSLGFPIYHVEVTCYQL